MSFRERQADTKPERAKTISEARRIQKKNNAVFREIVKKTDQEQ